MNPMGLTIEDVYKLHDDEGYVFKVEDHKIEVSE